MWGTFTPKEKHTFFLEKVADDEDDETTMMMMMMMTHLKGKSRHWQWLEACSSKVHFSIQGIEGKRSPK